VLLVNGRREDPGARPRAGCFTTLRAFRGVALFWRLHAARLRETAQALDLPAPDLERLASEVARAAGEFRDARVRVALVPGPGGGAARVVESEAVVPPAAPLRLRPVPAPPAGPLRRYKVADRLAYESVARAAAGADDALLQEAGDYLECTRSNLFLLAGETLLTPPDDGRILAGIARRSLLEACGELGYVAREARLGPEDARRADECLVTNAVLLAAPVAEIEGVARFARTGAAARIAGHLLRRALAAV